MAGFGRDDRDHLYDWVIRDRAIAGQHDLINRPLCGREVREAAAILHERGLSPTAIAERLRVAMRDLRPALATSGRTS
jgi:hypothetical protein